MSNYKRCDICQGFCDESELEQITIVISKHKGCKVDSLFGKTQFVMSNTHIASSDKDIIAPGNVIALTNPGEPTYVSEERTKMVIK